MKRFLKEKGCDYLFTQESSRRFLSPGCKKELFKQLTDYIESTYTLEAKEDEIIAVCLATICLFPSLKTEPSKIGGIVSALLQLRVKHIFLFSMNVFVGRFI